MKKYSKHISGIEKVVAAILGAMLILTVIVQVFFDGGVSLLLLILAVCTAVFSYLVFLPEIYELREDSLVVVNQLLQHSISVPYDTVLQIDTVGSFRNSKRDIDTVEVIVRYRPRGKKRTRSLSIHPKNVPDFFKQLQERCPNLIPELE